MAPRVTPKAEDVRNAARCRSAATRVLGCATTTRLLGRLVVRGKDTVAELRKLRCLPSRPAPRAALALSLHARRDTAAASWRRRALTQGTDLERALQDLTSKDNLQRLRELSEQDGTTRAYRNERASTGTSRWRATRAQRDHRPVEADWLLGGGWVGIEGVVALGVKDFDVREKLACCEQQINLQQQGVGNGGAARRRRAELR